MRRGGQGGCASQAGNTSLSGLQLAMRSGGHNEPPAPCHFPHPLRQTKPRTPLSSTRDAGCTPRPTTTFLLACMGRLSEHRTAKAASDLFSCPHSPTTIAKARPSSKRTAQLMRGRVQTRPAHPARRHESASTPQPSPIIMIMMADGQELPVLSLPAHGHCACLLLRLCSTLSRFTCS